MKAARLSELSGDLFVTAPTFSGHKLLPILAPALTARLLMTTENEPKIRGDKLPRADLTIEAFAAALLARLPGGAATQNWLCMNEKDRQEALASMREIHARWAAGELAEAEKRALIGGSARPWTPRRQTTHIRSGHPD